MNYECRGWVGTRMRLQTQRLEAKKIRVSSVRTLRYSLFIVSFNFFGGFLSNTTIFSRRDIFFTVHVFCFFFVGPDPRFSADQTVCSCSFRPEIRLSRHAVVTSYHGAIPSPPSRAFDILCGPWIIGGGGGDPFVSIPTHRSTEQVGVEREKWMDRKNSPPPPTLSRSVRTTKTKTIHQQSPTTSFFTYARAIWFVSAISVSVLLVASFPPAYREADAIGTVGSDDDGAVAT